MASVMAQDINKSLEMAMNLDLMDPYSDRIDTTNVAVSVMPPVTPVTLKPSVGYTLHLTLNIASVVAFSLIFLFVYVQLWMVLYYKHKRRSYQTIFLFLCLIWAALRVTLFSFYFSLQTIILANILHPILYWLLYSCPVVLQFTTLVLLVSFFSQVVIKARHPQDAHRYRFRVRLICTLSVIVFTLVNLVCGIIAQVYITSPCMTSSAALAARIGINGLLFVIYGVSLSYWIFSLNKIANARVLLESRGTNLLQSWLMCMFIVFIYVSRAVYNAVALAFHQYLPDFGYGILNVTDQADLVDLNQGYNYVVYLAALLLWEILPTLIVTVFFRVQKPSNIQQQEPSFDDVSGRHHQSFFDNPRRYDSDEDLSTRYGSNSYTASNRANTQAINSGISGSPSRTRPVGYDHRLIRSTSTVSRVYVEQQYNGT